MTKQRLVQTIAASVRALIPNKVAELEDRNEAFFLIGLVDAVLRIAREQWPGNSAVELEDMAPRLATRIAKAVAEDDWHSPARVFEEQVRFALNKTWAPAA